jgi:cation transport ATPase
MAGVDPIVVVVVGLIAFGIVFAMNSAIHSYLILAYTDSDKLAMNVGFYYILYNLIGLSLAAFGLLPPIFAAAQSLLDLGILANSSRLLRYQPPHKYLSEKQS